MVVLSVMAFALFGPPLPEANPDSAGGVQVSEARARQHLQAIACSPHAAGSSDNVAVREYLVAALEDLGLEPEVQFGERRGIPLANVLAKIPGTGEFAQGPDALLFACHFDSVDHGPHRSGPGAGDDGAAVATFLEVARVLLESKPLANDVWLLFTDGEERGLLGAEIFCREPEYLEDIALVFNFEAIGNRGPSVMFQTSRNNARVIEEFARAQGPKVAPSFAPAIYERLPNDTDFTVFQEHGLGGLNFAIVGGRSAYHHWWDTPENLTPGTLQFQLETVIGLAQHFGNLDPGTLSANSSRGFFDLFGARLVHFELKWNTWFLSLVALVLFAIWLTTRRQSGLGATVGATLGVMLRVGIGCAVFASLVPAIGEICGQAAGIVSEPQGDALSATLRALGAYAVSFAFLSQSFGRGDRDALLRGMVLGGGVLGLAVCFATFAWLPLGHYFAALPFAALGVAGLLARRASKNARTSYAAVLIALLALVFWLVSMGLLLRLMSHNSFVTVFLLVVSSGIVAPSFGVLGDFATKTWRFTLVVAVATLFVSGIVAGYGL